MTYYSYRDRDVIRQEKEDNNRREKYDLRIIAGMRISLPKLKCLSKPYDTDD